ncbi:MAG: SsrA-binding protein SmpB [Fidelibacterota bacterium]|nr:MAG: SsrA-binding protein SmpB [Candidatus Neomarinimicrobiota bacterium]
MDKRIVATNRKARHQYHILETYEAGLALVGTEVKALREAKVSLSDGYARFQDRELFLVSVHIGAYSHTGHEGHDSLRDRKLLLNRRELSKLRKAAEIKGQTLIPLSIYFREGWAKVELAVCKGKQVHDKRRDIADRELKRQIEREEKAHRASR